METKHAVEALGALAHEYRLGIYRLLVEQGPAGLAAGAIGEKVGLAPSSLTFHLQNLHRAGLIVQRRESRSLIYSVDFDAMNDLVGYLTENCCTASGNSSATACKPAPASKTVKRRKVA
jgi:ArsR family transcriptional regulator, arsenate/arsenite/antimonite-responsive transcriptional repressor